MIKTKYIDEQPYVVYNHKLARFLAIHDYFWTEARMDKLDSTRFIFIYKENIDEIKQLVEEYKKAQREHTENGLQRNLQTTVGKKN